MGANTKIEWADHTFNPWLGCTKISPACDHCYAEARMDAERWKYWKARLLAADFEWGLNKEPVLVFSLNCAVSADIDKSTDDAIAADASADATKGE